MIRKHLGAVLELADQKECKILEGYLMSDHSFHAESLMVYVVKI